MPTEPEIAALLLSLKVALTAALLGLPLSIALAWLLARKRFPGRMALDLIIHLPTVLPPVVVGFILLTLFGPESPIGVNLAFTWKAAALAALVMALPLMVRSVRAAMQAVDPRLEDMARSLGASEARVLWTVTLPLSRHGLIAGGVLGFARALAEFGATIAFAANIPGVTQTLPLAIFTALQSPGGEDAARRLSLISLVIAVVALLIAELIERRPGQIR